MKYSMPHLFDIKSTDSDNIRYVKSFLLSQRQSVNRIIKEKDEEARNIKELILSSTSYANDDFYTFKTRLYFFLMGYDDFPMCQRDGCCNKITGHNLRDLSTPHKFPNYCSDVCKYGNFETVQHRKDIAERLKMAKSFSDEEMISQLKQVIKEHPYNHVTHINAKNNWWSFLHDFIMSKTKMLDERYTMHTRIGWILNGYTDFPKCENENCTHTFEGRNIDRGVFSYPHFCSQSCVMNTQRVKEQCRISREKIFADRTLKRKKEIAHEKCIENSKKSDEEKIEILKKIVNDNPLLFDRVINSKCRFGVTDDNTYLVDFINSKTPLLLNGKYKMSTKLYWIFNGLTEFPKCKNCNKEFRDRDVKSIREGYTTYCSSKCAIEDGAFSCLSSFTYSFNGEIFHSSWELAYYIWLRDNKYDFEFHPKSPLPYLFNNETHYYYPDFIVDGRIVEIKGNQFFDDKDNLINPYCDDGGRSLQKQECMKRNNVLIFREKEIRPFLKYVEKTYGKNYLKQFRLTTKVEEM